MVALAMVRRKHLAVVLCSGPLLLGAAVLGTACGGDAPKAAPAKTAAKTEAPKK